jgi:hypothetical protein
MHTQNVNSLEARLEALITAARAVGEKKELHPVLEHTIRGAYISGAVDALEAIMRLTPENPSYLELQVAILGVVLQAGSMRADHADTVRRLKESMGATPH